MIHTEHVQHLLFLELQAVERNNSLIRGVARIFEDLKKILKIVLNFDLDEVAMGAGAYSGEGFSDFFSNC